MLLQYQILVFRNLADPSLFAIDLDAGKVFRETFFKPRIDSRGQDAVHELVRIFVEDDGPGILRRHIEHDEAAIFASLE